MSSSPASENFYALNEAPQWSIPQADREASLLSGLVELVDHHRLNCPEYERILGGLWQGGPAQKLEDIPYLPVSLFKTHLLQSVPQDQIRITMTSSGTTGAAVSRIAVDNETSRRQKLSLHASMAAILGKKRRPMLVIDSLAIVSDPALMSARGAGVLGMMPFGRDHCFALDESMNYRLDEVREWLAKHSGEEIFIFGFTFLVWQYLRGLAEELGSDLSKATLVHSGGWKKLQSEAVSPEVFRRTFRELAGLRNSYNFYGMVEQMGVLFLEGDDALLYPPNIGDVIIRDPLTFEPCPPGVEGVIQVLSLIPSSYPGHSILTEDVGVIETIDAGVGGRLGKALRIVGRLPKVELRGCSDVIAAESQRVLDAAL